MDKKGKKLSGFHKTHGFPPYLVNHRIWRQLNRHGVEVKKLNDNLNMKTTVILGLLIVYYPHPKNKCYLL